MVQIFKNHKWAVLIAFASVLIIIYPQVFFRYDQRDVYRGIELIGAADDESAWLSRVREAKDGHFSLASPYFKDGKNDPYLIQPLGSIIIAVLGNFFSLDLNNTILLSRLVFPFIVFLLLYSFLYLFTKEKLIALAITTSFFLGKVLLSRKAIFQLLSGDSPSTTFLDFVRPVNPTMTWLFFFGFLLFFWLFLERKQWHWGILSALTLGLSFYDYFYTWTFLYAFCGVLAAIFFLKKKWPDVKRIMAVILGALILAIPYFFNLYQVVTHPNYQQVGQRFGLLEGRFFHFGLLVPLLFIIFLLFFPKKWQERYYFALALIITPFIVLNQQLITNKVLSYDHYHWYFHLPLAFIFILVIFFSLSYFQKRQLFKKISAVLIMLITGYVGIFIQNSSYAARQEQMIEKQRYGEVMDWLNENAEKEEVVFANNETSHLTVIYTPLNVFYHSSAMLNLAATRERLLDIIFLFYRLQGISKDEASEVFSRDERDISFMLYGIHYRDSTGDYRGMPDEIIDELIQKYKDSFRLSTVDFLNNLWEKYQVKYLVWDKKNNPSWQLDQYQFLKKAVEIGDFAIYKF